MCIHCITKPIMVKENLLPGWHLFRATEGIGVGWNAGELALCDSHQSADIVFPVDTEFVETDWDSPNRDWFKITESTRVVLESINKIKSPYQIYQLIQSCINAGYNVEEDGTAVEYWLTNAIAKALAADNGDI